MNLLFRISCSISRTAFTVAVLVRARLFFDFLVCADFLFTNFFLVLAFVAPVWDDVLFLAVVAFDFARLVLLCFFDGIVGSLPLRARMNYAFQSAGND